LLSKKDEVDMKVNRAEFILVNNPLRGLIQEEYELNILCKMSSLKDIEIALEIGCGNGNGTKLRLTLMRK